jgi:hypothetical protein
VIPLGELTSECLEVLLREPGPSGVSQEHGEAALGEEQFLREVLETLAGLVEEEPVT